MRRVAYVPSILAHAACVLVLGGFGAAMPAYGQGVRSGQAAPSFSLVAPDGKQLFLKDLQPAGKPIFLFFINDRDNTSSSAAAYINRIARAYTPSSVKWYGIVNAREDRARSYQSEFNPPYQIFLDPELSTIQLFGASSSPFVVMIDGKGRIGRVWSGYSAPNLKSLNQAVARANGRRVAKIDFSRTPSTVQWGHNFARSGGG